MHHRRSYKETLVTVLSRMSRSVTRNQVAGSKPASKPGLAHHKRAHKTAHTHVLHRRDCCSVLSPYCCLVYCLMSMLLLSIISRSVTSRHTNPVAGSRPASMLDLLHAVNPLPEADVYALVARMLVSVCGCVCPRGSDAG